MGFRGGGFADFDHYVAEHGIPPEDHPAAFALWYAETTGEPVPRFEKVEPQGPSFEIEGDDLLWPGHRTEKPGL